MQRDELLSTLKSRFEEHPDRHPGLSWAKVQTRLESHPEKLTALHEMELTGGEPDVVGHDKKTGELRFVDCSPETPKGNAWIPADTKEGETYWDALQIVREWTKANHYVLHDMAAEAAGIKSLDRFWNEHNFVFRKSDGLFYHGKGATPAFDGWASDATDLTIIPLNMAEPILIVRGQNASNGLGFSPHGAGRNFSRTQHRRRNDHRTDAEIFTEETAGIDARFFMGIPDISELPSAYKNAASVRSQIDEYGLAEIVDEVLPLGCIMAGDWEKEAPWRKLPTPQDKETGR